MLDHRRRFASFSRSSIIGRNGTRVGALETRTETAEAENRFDTGFWIGLGAVALGGVVALIIVQKKKDDEDE